MVIYRWLAKTRALKENDDGQIVCGIVWDSADRKGTSKNAGEGAAALPAVSRIT
jgi:hypothetical protein